MKKSLSIEEFDALTKEEQDEVINELRQELGGHAIPMNMYVTKEVSEWWGAKVAQDKAGSTSIELLMSKFFMALIRCVLVEGERGFMQKVYIALALLVGTVQVRQDATYSAIEQQMCNCEEEGTSECPFDDMDELPPRRDNGEKKTYN